MLTENHLNKYTDILLWGLKTARKEKFRKNDVILIQYDLPALKLAEILFARIIDMGMHPVQRMAVTKKMEFDFYKRSNHVQLKFIAPGDRELHGNINGRIYLRAPESLTHLKDIDPKRIGTVLVSRKPLRKIMDDREDIGAYSWTLCSIPTMELAGQAKTGLAEYEKQIIKACYLDISDPVKKWDDILKNANSIKKWLNSLKVRSYRIESKNIDLKITPGEKRKWAGVSGHNIPSFEIFTSPDWQGTVGSYYSNLPTFRSGNYVEGIRLVFSKGSVVKAGAKKGGGFVNTQIKMDAGASRIGEFSLTDKRFSRIDRFMADTLYDENYGGKYGNCHIALGSSYSDAFGGDPSKLDDRLKKGLGFNDSALHWDLVNTEDKVVTAALTGGKSLVVYENGIFNY